MSDEAKNDLADQPAEPGAAAEKSAESHCECPEVRLAAEAVRLAKMELEKAEKFYEDVRRHATEKLQVVCKITVGDIIDRTLVTVKRHPGPSLLVSAALGFCLGRRFQKLFKKK